MKNKYIITNKETNEILCSFVADEKKALMLFKKNQIKAGEEMVLFKKIA